MNWRETIGWALVFMFLGAVVSGIARADDPTPEEKAEQFRRYDIQWEATPKQRELRLRRRSTAAYQAARQSGRRGGHRKSSTRSRR